MIHFAYFEFYGTYIKSHIKQLCTTKNLFHTCAKQLLQYSLDTTSFWSWQVKPQAKTKMRTEFIHNFITRNELYVMLF